MVIIRAGFPAFPWRPDAFFQPLVLLGLGCVQENLHQPHAIGQQQCLEIIDFLEGIPPTRLRREAIDPLHQHPAVPGAIEHGDFAIAGQALPEPPQIMARRLLARGRRDRPDLAEPRIKRRVHPRHQPALARCVPAFDGNYAFQALHDIGGLDQLQPMLQGFELRFIIAARQIMINFEIGEIVRAHGRQAGSPPAWRQALLSRRCGYAARAAASASPAPARSSSGLRPSASSGRQ